jgi:plasmid maintenance system antidote protein VapI
MAKSNRLPPIHPGEILHEDFMKPLGLSMNRLALDLRVPVTRIAEIVHQRHGRGPHHARCWRGGVGGITPDTALRLGRYFNTSARFWMNAQAGYDLEVAHDQLQRTIERDVRPRVA